MCDSQTGWRAGELLVEHGVIGWARLVDALLFGLVKRRPELAPVAAVVWCELALPYYMEPFYSESKLGAFIDAAIDVPPTPGRSALGFHELLGPIEA